MNNHTNIAVHLSVRPKSMVNKTSLVSLSFSPVAYLVDDLCWHASYQHCGKLLFAWVKLFLWKS